MNNKYFIYLINHHNLSYIWLGIISSRYFILNIIMYFIDLKNALVYRKKVNKNFNPKDFEIVRKKQDISRIKQKIMVK